MNAVVKKPAKKPVKNPKLVTIARGDSETEEAAVAKAALSPALNGALVADAYQRNVMGDDIHLMALADALGAQAKQVQNGDLSGFESMLVGQATALQSIFTSLARRAQVQTQQRHLEAFLSLALKAQSQSRATIATLAELKYPRQVAFVKQANISHGRQQINNGSRTQEIQSQRDKLFVEHDDGGKTMDTRATTKTGGSYPALETVESIDRPDHS
jgi:hypothetical protein